MKPGPRITPRQAGAVNAPIQHERRRVAARLAAAGCIAADLEAIELCSAAENAAALEESVARRERGEPLAWITGVTRFCGRRLRVDAGVYVPRPQSEAMAEMAADRLPPGGTAVDLCTGTGAIAHHLRHRAPGATVIAVDCYIRAVRCATRNGVAALLGDLGAALRSDSFDVVTARPPCATTSRSTRSTAGRTGSTSFVESSATLAGSCAPAAGCSSRSARARTRYLATRCMSID